MVLASYHPGQSVETVRAATGWDLRVAPEIRETPAPTDEELAIVRDCDPAGVTSAGNAAGTGSRVALLNRAARPEIEGVVRRVEKVETAVEPRFQEHFVNAMAIPHETDSYERLGAVVALPPRRAVSARERSGRRRRRVPERRTS